MLENPPNAEELGVLAKSGLSSQLDDLNEPFTFKSNHFDVVQSRMVGGGINASRWPSYLRDIKRCVQSHSIKVVDH